MLVWCLQAKHKHSKKASFLPKKQATLNRSMKWLLCIVMHANTAYQSNALYGEHLGGCWAPPEYMELPVFPLIAAKSEPVLLVYLQTVLRWDRSSIINVGEETLACVFIGPGPLDLSHSICPAALHTQQLSRTAERGALAWCFVEAPEHHCPQSPKLT